MNVEIALHPVCVSLNGEILFVLQALELDEEFHAHLTRVTSSEGQLHIYTQLS